MEITGGHFIRLKGIKISSEFSIINIILTSAKIKKNQEIYKSHQG